MKYTTKLRADNVLEIYRDRVFLASAIFNGKGLSRNEAKMHWHTPELRLIIDNKRIVVCMVGTTLEYIIKNPECIEKVIENQKNY